MLLFIPFTALSACHREPAVLSDDTSCAVDWHVDADGDGYGAPEPVR